MGDRDLGQGSGLVGYLIGQLNGLKQEVKRRVSNKWPKGTCVNCGVHRKAGMISSPFCFYRLDMIKSG